MAALAALMLAACATPSRTLDMFAERQGMSKQIVSGLGFRHVIYRQAGQGSGDTLHVYIEGDGRPWWTRGQVARDPTSRYRLALELLAMDDSPGVYLGRPCYHGLAQTTPCQPIHWTHQRYSDAVVASLADVLRREIAAGAHRQVVLIGHSGGGALAVLLAGRIPETTAVVTLAANLDIAAWVRHHGYSPLAGSLNPARQLPLASGIWQLHLVGARDDNTPPWLVSDALRRQPDAHFSVIEGFDHRCCWQSLWPSVLEAVAHRDAGLLDAD